ncbi:uncharacterized protein [Typha angustifolia]|uniref:uncharacterized protein n=1 Tax=Typha angustifolia TaxID=59011 RepID=UPI003C2CF2A8
MSGSLKVEDLMSGGQWNTANINDEGGFDLAFEVAPTTSDQWIWWPHPKGKPAASSIYRFLTPREELWTKWRALWQLRVATRVRLFCWKLAWQRIPTAAYLVNLNLGIGDVCNMCGLYSEIATHLLFNCWFSQEVWAHVDEELGGDSDLAAQGIWKQRNRVVFGGDSLPVCTVARQALQMAEEYGEVKWKLSAPGWTKLNIDGAWLNGSYQGGFGAVLRDAAGRVIGITWGPPKVANRVADWAAKRGQPMAVVFEQGHAEELPL